MKLIQVQEDIMMKRKQRPETSEQKIDPAHRPQQPIGHAGMKASRLPSSKAKEEGKAHRSRRGSGLDLRSQQKFQCHVIRQRLGSQKM